MNLYHKVPKDYAKNLAYRLEVRKRAANDPGFRGGLIQACREDILGFINLFGWLYEPRPAPGKPHKIPFISWPHQDNAILTIKPILGYEDIGCTKSRGEGMSWIAIYLAEHDWLFTPLSAIGFVSRTRDAVDSPDDSDSLFWKLIWSLDQLPAWLRPPYKRNIDKSTLRNEANGSVITGYAATADVASGGRKRCFLMDELAKFPRGPDREAMTSTQHVTNSRLVVSTPKGAEGAYYDIMHQPSSMVKITLDWKMNPTRNRGLYRMEKGKPVAIDPVNNPLPSEAHPYILPGKPPLVYDPPNQEALDLFSRLKVRGHRLDGKLRSPWYDHECDRPGEGGSPQGIAQDLDMDYGGSMARVLLDDFHVKAKESILPPFLTGRMRYHPETLEPDFGTAGDGLVKLWCNLDAQGRPPRHQYVVGNDISTGGGGSYTSNSVCQVVDLVTMEQVMEFAINTIRPSDFADHAIAICKWFWDAYLVWEINGPGGVEFTARVKEKGYPYLYRREQGDGAKVFHKKSKDLGWHTNKNSKARLFTEIDSQVRYGGFKMRSAELVQECGQYVFQGDKIVHIGAANSENDGEMGEAHGDRVMAIGVALMGVKDRPLLSKKVTDGIPTGPPPPNTMAAREQEYQERMRQQQDDWQD
jgi:hypothetical protein